MAIIAFGVNDLMHHVAQTIGERHSCDFAGIYLVGSGGQNLHLDGWQGDFDYLDQHTRQTDHLLPALTAESGLDRVLESLVAEFERTSEIPVHLSISGSASQVAISEVVGFCRVLQYHLAEILRNGGASEVRVDLEIESDNIRLMMWYNSHYDDAIEETLSAMRERVAQLAEDMGGELRISNSFDMGVRVEVVLNTGSVSLDSFDNNRRQRISETGIADGPGNRERN